MRLDYFGFLQLTRVRKLSFLFHCSAESADAKWAARRPQSRGMRVSLSRWFGRSAVRGDELLGAVSNLPQPLFSYSLPLIPQADNVLVESRNMGDKIGTLPFDMGPNMITQKTMLLFVQILSN